jgi:hypothetical protein
MVCRVTTSKIAAAASKVLARRGRSVESVLGVHRRTSSSVLQVPRKATSSMAATSIIPTTKQQQLNHLTKIVVPFRSGTFSATNHHHHPLMLSSSEHGIGSEKRMDYHHHSIVPVNAATITTIETNIRNVTIDPYLANLLDGFCNGSCDHQFRRFHHVHNTPCHQTAQQSTTMPTVTATDPTTTTRIGTRHYGGDETTIFVASQDHHQQKPDQRDNTTSSPSTHAKNVAHMILLRKELLLMHQLLEVLY